MSWATGLFYAERLHSYLSDIPWTKRRKNLFPLDQDGLDEHIASTCVQFFWLNGILAISLLQAAYEFAGYLEASPAIPATAPDTIRRACLNMFENCKKALDDPDPGARIYADFPDYRWSR